jgi:hypothetical protein
VRIAARFALVGHRRVALRRGGPGVVHRRVCSQNVSQAVSRVGLVGARGCAVHDDEATRRSGMRARCLVPQALLRAPSDWLRVALAV